MKLLKQIVSNIAPFVASMLFWYLAGSFIAASWLPADWSVQLRIVMTITGTAWGMALWMRVKWEQWYGN